MIDLHTHTLLSDGALIPSELCRRAEVMGVRVLAITDHVDPSNIETVAPRAVEVCESLKGRWKIRAIPGVEITHCPVETIASLVKRARELGSRVVVVHGETLMEPVPEGTNRAAIEAGADILAHPGLISEEDARRAAEAGVHLEITGRKGHSLTNGHVAALAERFGVRLVLNSDTHGPGDLFSLDFARKIARGAGIKDVAGVFKNSEDLVAKII